MGLYQSVIDFLKNDEAGNEESVLDGLNDIQRAMCHDYAESEECSLKDARERLHLQ